MSADDGFKGEMRIDHEIEQLLSGAASGEPALGGFVAELRSFTAARVPEAVASRQAAAAAAAVVLGGSPCRVVIPLTPRFDPARPVRHRIAAARAVMAAAACLALVLSLAAVEVLPAPVQAAVASFADRVGVHLPTPDDAGRGDPERSPRSPGSGSGEPSTPEGLTPTTPGPAPPPGADPAAPPVAVPGGPPDGTPTPPGSPSAPPTPPTPVPAAPPDGAPGSPPQNAPGGQPPGIPSGAPAAPDTPTSGPPAGPGAPTRLLPAGGG